jgi:dihydropteroate synthase
VGASRKRVIAFAAGGACAPKERLAGTIAAHTVAQLGGADILRVHDVAPALQAARMADAIRAAGISI